jgi:hypothetical protein
MRKKPETKQERYNKKMENKGYVRRCYWIHPDDIPKAITYLAKLRDKRENK